MGRVFKARDLQLERTVAIKLLHEHKVQDRSAVQRLRREAKALSEVRHDNICEIYQVVLSPDGRLYIVSEFVDGSSLKKLLADRRTLPEQETTAIFSQVLRALALVHERGLIHRDITPANILITADGAVKLIDFGIAKSLDGEAGQKLTQTGAIVGTPDYMSPEQLTGKPLDGRADLFAVGVCFYEALSGRLPWDGSANLADLHARWQAEPRPLPSGLSARTKGVILQALSAQSDARFATADGMAQALAGAAPYTVRRRISNKRLAGFLLVLSLIVIGIAVGAGAYQASQHDLQLEEETRYRQQYRAALKEVLWRMRLGKQSESLRFAREAVEASRHFPSDEKEKLIAELYLQAVLYGLNPVTPDQLEERVRRLQKQRGLLGEGVYAWLMSNSAWLYYSLSVQPYYERRRDELHRLAVRDFKEALIAESHVGNTVESREDFEWYCKSVDKVFSNRKSPADRVAFYDAVFRDISTENQAVTRTVNDERIKARRELYEKLSNAPARLKLLKEIIDLDTGDSPALNMFEVYREYGERLFAEGEAEEGLRYMRRGADDLIQHKKGEEERGRLLIHIAGLNQRRGRPDLSVPDYVEGIRILKLSETGNADQISQAEAALATAYRQMKQPPSANRGRSGGH